MVTSLPGRAMRALPIGTPPISNSQFYRNNDIDDGGGLLDTEMDGLTTVLTCQASVDAGAVNHMKLAIADTSDNCPMDKNAGQTDTDKDGATDYAEFVAGTDPGNPNSELAPSSPTVAFKIIPDPVVRALEMRRGSVDLVVNDLPPDSLSYFATHGFPVFRTPGASYAYLGLNCSRPPLDRREVRLALALAIDRESLVRYILRGFGRPATGMWPAEGAVSQEAASVFSRNGIQWIAADEKILSRSNPAGLSKYFPYRIGVQKSGGPGIAIVFRDTELSDKIGFTYQHYRGEDAARDFIAGVFQRMPPEGEPGRLLTVILDGENAWEYFHDSGVEFQNVLFSKLEKLRPNIEFITLSEALDEVGQVRELPSIPTGSWIDGTFHIWIGHAEDQAAWEILSRARTLLESKSVAFTKEGKEEPPDLQKARDYLMVAEGSDWCWWYGDDHYTPHGPEFDRLFRHNVKAAYKAMGVIPPDSIDIPIIKTDRIVQEKNVIPAPGSYIQPRIDGAVTSYFEWNSARKIVPDPGFGAMHRAGHVILSCFYYGFSVDEVFFRFDLDKIAVENVHAIELEVLFQEKCIKFNSTLDPMSRRFSYSLGKIGESRGESNFTQETGKEPGNVRAAFGTVLELAISFETLECTMDERLEFFVTIRIPGSFGERWPIYGTFSAELPGTDFTERMWHA